MYDSAWHEGYWNRGCERRKDLNIVTSSKWLIIGPITLTNIHIRAGTNGEMFRLRFARKLFNRKGEEKNGLVDHVSGFLTVADYLGDQWAITGRLLQRLEHETLGPMMERLSGDEAYRLRHAPKSTYKFNTDCPVCGKHYNLGVWLCRHIERMHPEYAAKQAASKGEKH